MLREYSETLLHQQESEPEYLVLTEQHKKKHLELIIMCLTAESKGLPCNLPVLLSLGIPHPQVNVLSLQALRTEML